MFLDNFGVIVQARLSSTRLPGKVLKPLYGEVKVLEFLAQRFRTLSPDTAFIIATSEEPSDDAIEDFAHTLNIPIFRGSLEDVALRYLEAAGAFKLKTFARVTGDNPFTDPRVVELARNLHLGNGAKYTSTKLARGYPVGTDVEIVDVKFLATNATGFSTYEREHVTVGLYHPPDRVLLDYQAVDRSFDRLSKVRLTIDTPADLSRAKKIVEIVANCGDPIIAPWSEFAKAATALTSPHHVQTI